MFGASQDREPFEVRESVQAKERMATGLGVEVVGSGVTVQTQSVQPSSAAVAEGDQAVGANEAEAFR
ncbi:hypothetical protein E2562_038717 [Oryza meyeriana var. granulata]|uniref:Uncharacterized protein n=1 Tax=Oryza meyeriana var. granulata TaxID=110450 RepID=A0A6G1C1S1_9ORYZ|nr:hypothetical protein E2562_038717 [Oryza meyeriana var. granulata]